MPATKQMTERAALTAARKRWGKGGGVIKRRSPSSEAERKAGHEELIRLRALPLPPKPDPVIPGSPEWQAWRETVQAHHKAKNDAFGEATHYQYHVGAIFMGFAFEIKGSGDTWEQAFEAAKSR